MSTHIQQGVRLTARNHTRMWTDVPCSMHSFIYAAEPVVKIQQEHFYLSRKHEVSVEDEPVREFDPSRQARCDLHGRGHFGSKIFMSDVGRWLVVRMEYAYRVRIDRFRDDRVFPSALRRTTRSHICICMTSVDPIWQPSPSQLFVRPPSQF